MSATPHGAHGGTIATMREDDAAEADARQSDGYGPTVPEDERCMDESGCDERATMFRERGADGWHDAIYCAEHAPEGSVPLHTGGAS